MRRSKTVRGSKTVRRSKTVRQRRSAHSGTAFPFVKRNAVRVFVRLPASITVDASVKEEHVAFVRDISRCGVFFYSNLRPTKGDLISFTLNYKGGAKKVQLPLTGVIVRVEQASPASATGIAVAFDSPHEEVPRSPIHVR